MSTKHFINDPAQVVPDSLQAVAAANPTLAFWKENKAIVNLYHDSRNTVTIASGGGAGHEPAHASFVGDGMIAAAISGTVFASPSVAQIVNTVSGVVGKGNGKAKESKGVLLLAKNYTGDVLHFNLAAGKLRGLGIPTEVTIVEDDVSVGRKKSGRVGRRGLAGTVLVQKIAGATAAKPGSTLADVKQISDAVNANLATVGVSLNHAHLPGKPVEEMLQLGQDELELGMGIHNEPGCEKLRPIPDSGALVSRMLDALLDPNDTDRAYVAFAETKRVVLLVNNLGGLSVLELGGIATEVIKQLKSRGFTLDRVYIGSFVTSLNQPGFSVTLLKSKDIFLEHLDAPTGALGWTGKQQNLAERSPVVPEAEAAHVADEGVVGSNVTLDTETFKSAIVAGCNKVIQTEPDITKYDMIAGDGDCGATLKRGAQGIITFLDSPSFTPNAVATLASIAEVIETKMDGSSGALYSIFLHGFINHIRSLSTNTLTADNYAGAAVAGLQALQAATPAQVGDRTMLDALIPFVEGLRKNGGRGDPAAVKEAVQAARQGMEATRDMAANLGRAVYVARDSYKGQPDAGAVGIAAFVEGAFQA